MLRGELLDQAKAIVTRDRQATHGKPEDTFGLIAALWSAYLNVPVKPHDVAAMMALLKIGRIRANAGNMDNWLDAAGYSACGAELASAGLRDCVHEWQPHHLFPNVLACRCGLTKQK